MFDCIKYSADELIMLVAALNRLYVTDLAEMFLPRRSCFSALTWSTYCTCGMIVVEHENVIPLVTDRFKMSAVEKVELSFLHTQPTPQIGNHCWNWTCTFPTVTFWAANPRAHEQMRIFIPRGSLQLQEELDGLTNISTFRRKILLLHRCSQTIRRLKVRSTWPFSLPK